MSTVMGIINVNNESFYAASRCNGEEDFSERIERMIANGASIIDIGACSTKPGSTPVTQEQEWNNLKVPLKYIANIAKKKYPDTKFSIDTFRSEIVRRSYDLIGDFIVNDISAGEDDKEMLQTVSNLKLGYIAMHKRGVPNTMQSLCDYPNGVVNEVIDYFKKFNDIAVDYGISEYIIDPGFGFAKTVEQNYELLEGIPKIIEEVSEYAKKNIPLLAALSRKSMIWKPLGITPEESLPATSALNLQCLLKGASIIRVHDVKEGMQCITLSKLLRSL